MKLFNRWILFWLNITFIWPFIKFFDVFASLICVPLFVSLVIYDFLCCLDTMIFQSLCPLFLKLWPYIVVIVSLDEKFIPVRQICCAGYLHGYNRLYKIAWYDTTNLPSCSCLEIFVSIINFPANVFDRSYFIKWSTLCKKLRWIY